MKKRLNQRHSVSVDYSRRASHWASGWGQTCVYNVMLCHLHSHADLPSTPAVYSVLYCS